MLTQPFRTPGTRLLLGLLALAAVAARAAAGQEPREDHADARPNFVVFLADDAGVECFGCYGGTSYETPAIDRLAGEGLRFAHAHAQPLCTPSRVALLTGRSNLRNYVTFSILDPAETTFAQVLRGAGYRTGAAGKWQLLGARSYGEWAGRGTTPGGAGFDEWCLWQVTRLGSRYADPLLEVDGELREHPGAFGPHVVRDWCKDFLTRHRDEPFCLFVPHILPHDPHVDVPGREPAADAQGRFAGMVACLDGVVGDVVAHLDALGLGERTLVLFLGDNGTSRAITSEQGGRAVRGGKGTSLDTGTHVPFVARWTGRVPAGGVADDLVELPDVAATLVALAGARFPEGLAVDGLDLAPRLTRAAPVGRDALVCYSNPRPGNPGFPAQLWARDRRWKLYADGRLFDVVADPDEHAPLPTSVPDDGAGGEAGAARARLARRLEEAPSPPPWLAGGAPSLDWREAR